MPTGARGSSHQRASQRLLAAGGGIIGGRSSSRAATGTAAARNASYSGPGPSGAGSTRAPQRGAPLSKDMLASLDNYNKIRERGSKKIDRVADSIEAASNQRRSRGELKPLDQKQFQPTQEILDEANGVKDKENKPANSSNVQKANAPRPPTNPHQQRKPPLKGPASQQPATKDKEQ